MKAKTLQVAALCAIGTIVLVLFFVSGCYIGQEGTATLSTILDAGALEPAELDAGNGHFPGESDASTPMDASARPSSAELDAGAPGVIDADLTPDCGLPWILGLCAPPR